VVSAVDGDPARRLNGGLGGRGALIVTGLLLPLLAVLCWRPLTTLDGSLGVRDEEIDVLRAQRHRYPAGVLVFEQGDAGRAFYVIVKATPTWSATAR
jgi:hypothetical protein